MSEIGIRLVNTAKLVLKALEASHLNNAFAETTSELVRTAEEATKNIQLEPLAPLAPTQSFIPGFLRSGKNARIAQSAGQIENLFYQFTGGLADFKWRKDADTGELAIFGPGGQSFLITADDLSGIKVRGTNGNNGVSFIHGTITPDGDSAVFRYENMSQQPPTKHEARFLIPKEEKPSERS